jgi:hypothetical protein
VGRGFSPDRLASDADGFIIQNQGRFFMVAAWDPEKRIAELLTKVIELGGDGLEIEYRNGNEEITAMKGSFGFGISEIKSSSRQAAALRDELWSLRNRTKRIEVRGKVYKARVNAVNSFGETAYRIKIG